MFNIGQIFENTYTIEVAEWCNNNNCYIEEIEPINGVRRFEVKEVQPYIETEEERQQRISKLYMTRSDFFDGTIMAWGIGQDELLVLIQELLNTLHIEDVKKMIAINNFKNALNFYRKHDLFKMLVNIPIQLTETLQVTLTDEHLDKFFDEVNKGNKETAWQYLPQPVVSS